MKKTYEQTEKVNCNKCGKEINPLVEDYLFVEKKWGYFSKVDGTHDTFRICEECYYTLTNEFTLNIERREQTEMM